MSPRRPPLPEGRPPLFRATVHGTVFAGRERHLEALSEGDELYLIPDPPGGDTPAVWVHATTFEPIGHLPPEIGRWLAPWMLEGGSARARAIRVSGEDVPSWRRVLLEVRCEPGRR